MEELEQIIQDIEKVKAKNIALGDILAFNFNISLKEYQAFIENKQLDLSDKINMISSILGVDLEELVKHIINNKISSECSDPQLEEYIKSDQAPEKFSDEEYQEFLKEIQGVAE